MKLEVNLTHNPMTLLLKRAQDCRSMGEVTLGTKRLPLLQTNHVGGLYAERVKLGARRF